MDRESRFKVRVVMILVFVFLTAIAFCIWG